MDLAIIAISITIISLIFNGIEKSMKDDNKVILSHDVQIALYKARLFKSLMICYSAINVVMFMMQLLCAYYIEVEKSEMAGYMYITFLIGGMGCLIVASFKYINNLCSKQLHHSIEFNSSLLVNGFILVSIIFQIVSYLVVNWLVSSEQAERFKWFVIIVLLLVCLVSGWVIDSIYERKAEERLRNYSNGYDGNLYLTLKIVDGDNTFVVEPDKNISIDKFGNIWVFDRNSNIDIKMYKFSDGVKVVNGDKVIMDKDSFDKIINLVRM